MLSYQLLEYYQAVVKILEEAEEPVSLLLKYAQTFEIVSTDIIFGLIKAGILWAEGKDDRLSFIENSQATLNGYISDFKESFRLTAAINGFRNLERKLKDCQADIMLEDPIVDSFIELTQKMLESYEDCLRYNQDYHRQDLLFSQKAVDFKREIESIKRYYKNSVTLLSSCDYEEILSDDSNREFEIQLLGIEYSFENFIKYLDSIQIIYEELKLAMYHETSVCDLSIVKIESGSLLGKFLGEKNIVEAMGLLITKTINLVFAKFTKEGKIERNSKMRQQLSEDLDLRSRLKELGFDVSSADETIEKAFAVITKETYILATGASRFKINKEELSYRGYREEKYLEEIKTLYITDADKFDKPEE